ncbi:MAG: gephyrin-like molybdotransferase Glp [bacterium]
MIGFDEALGRVLDLAPLLPVEKVPLEDAVGRVLARPATARFGMPRFDASAMDGYAVKLSDVDNACAETPAILELAGELPAGDATRRTLRHGQTIKVFTGSNLPAGTDAVVKREYCQEAGDGTVWMERPALGREHIRFKGEEYHRGDTLLEAGTILDPPQIGLLATFGHAEVPVHEIPSVTLITMGDELVPLGESLGPSQIYNSNSFALQAALQRLGVTVARTLTLPDDPAALRRAIRQGLRRGRMVVTAGGASVGDYDFVRPVAGEVGIREIFRQIAIKPGKPVFFGTWQPDSSRRHSERRLFFGLPGNPVSALVSYHQLVKPALLKMMGRSAVIGQFLTATLAADLHKRPGRRVLVRGVLEVDLPSEPGGSGLHVRPVTRQGSHMPGGLASADCLILFPSQATELYKGDAVRVQLLSWGR